MASPSCLAGTWAALCPRLPPKIKSGGARERMKGCETTRVGLTRTHTRRPSTPRLGNLQTLTMADSNGALPLPPAPPP